MPACVDSYQGLSPLGRDSLSCHFLAFGTTNDSPAYPLRRFFFVPLRLRSRKDLPVTPPGQPPHEGQRHNHKRPSLRFHLDAPDNLAFRYHTVYTQLADRDRAAVRTLPDGSSIEQFLTIQIQPLGPPALFSQIDAERQKGHDQDYQADRQLSIDTLANVSDPFGQIVETKETEHH